MPFNAHVCSRQLLGGDAAKQIGAGGYGGQMNNLCEVQLREAVSAERRQSGFVNALRVHRALTAGIEKRLLVWIALRMPAAINSDHLTGLGFVSQLLAGAAYALASRDWRALWLVKTVGGASPRTQRRHRTVLGPGRQSRCGIRPRHH